MSNIDKGQVTSSAAEIYEEFFLPALFQEWTDRVADAVQIQVGQSVLDVACGTGVLTRTIAERAGDTGSVIGLDINEGMLAVAARKAPQIEWRQGNALSLPFDNDCFDAVVSQFGLMFFEDWQVAIREMARVLKPGGRLAVAVWDSLDNTPGYAAMVDLLDNLFGETTAKGLRVPFILGDKSQLRSLFAVDGLLNVKVTTVEGQARFPSIDAWVFTDIKGWVLADVLDDAQVDRLLEAARSELSTFVTSQGNVVFKSPAHIVTAIKSNI
jgi:SAM-dependent methyltransferase